MAKALLGHVGAADLQTAAELRRLRERVRELEAELVRLQAENAALAAAHDGLRHDELLTLRKEPALA